jgi:hypothetical protein
MNDDPDGLDRTAGFRSRATALALFTAPWGFVLANGAYAWATRSGGQDIDGAGALAVARAHPHLQHFGSTAAMLASFVMVPAILGAMRLTRVGAARLGLIGGVLTSAAYICYFAMLSGDRFTYVMATHPAKFGEYAKILDDSLKGGSVVWYFAFFAIGNLIGTFLLGLALLRSHAIPRWAALAVMAWSVLHVVGLASGSEFFEVAGAAAEAVGLAVVGRRLLSRRAEAPTAVRRSQPSAAMAG